jgi:hypothetical protein
LMIAHLQLSYVETTAPVTPLRCSRMTHGVHDA